MCACCTSYLAVENTAKMQKHPVQTQEYGEPHERCGPAPAQLCCQALLHLGGQHSLQTGTQARLELCGQPQIQKIKQNLS